MLKNNLEKRSDDVRRSLLEMFVNTLNDMAKKNGATEDIFTKYSVDRVLAYGRRRYNSLD